MGRRAKQDDLESKQPTVLDPVTDAGEVERDKEDDGGKLPELDPSPARHEVPIAVVEQRVSNLAQGSMCLVLLTGPFLHVLNLIPRGVLAGLLLVSLISCAGVLTNEEFCAFLQLVHGVGCVTRERRHSQDSISLQRSPPYTTDWAFTTCPQIPHHPLRFHPAHRLWRDICYCADDRLVTSPQNSIFDDEIFDILTCFV